ncbi:MAG: hypothetical protein IPO14_06310 [Saprospiraceae bacterium]|nr:hypothetical protein [Saprospiraceae bacterium]
MQNPPRLPNVKTSDYLMEGHYFDCKTPMSASSPRNFWSNEIEESVRTHQAYRFVINLDNWGGDVVLLQKQFKDWLIPNLEEIIIVKNGAISKLDLY